VCVTLSSAARPRRLTRTRTDNLRMTRCLRTFAVLVLSLTAACASAVNADAEPCLKDADCMEGLRCDGGGVCVLADEDGCSTDLECAAGESCVAGACAFVNEGATLCDTTADCTVTHACVSGVCAPLADGACRVSAQCPAQAPACDAPSANEVGACVVVVEPEPACVEHASIVDGTNDCRCDDGYVANGDQSACVPVRGAEPPPAEEPPVSEPPVSEPPAQQPPPDAPPPEEPPVDEPLDCGPNASPDPYDDDYCLCDWLYVPNEQGTACVDECEELGWYGDGFYCDECAWPDPDCY
jgi:hypothetical protein